MQLSSSILGQILYFVIKIVIAVPFFCSSLFSGSENAYVRFSAAAPTFAFSANSMQQPIAVKSSFFALNNSILCRKKMQM